ncbi:hypothetical protein [Bythopirellula polymerisocia]|uniref:Uncharacterized protein n=1 Tax=Bythopirellula polymerisocia TaxID=2528003 RepID=A0A5C6CN07_9BACT|nr:hypothetical protein [Bythopirellula polymerisocia]TWU25808.1 hypothetical protein Pla144_30200 [Bythopirellula polymerisocia]
MNIESECELNVTREKLAKLRARFEEVRRNATDKPIDKLTLQSLKRMINQLAEEIVVYESRIGAGS